MKLYNKILFFLFLGIGVFLRAEGPPAPTPPGGSGGGGGVGPGGVASPIDMYIYILGVIAVLFMIYYHLKSQKKLI